MTLNRSQQTLRRLLLGVTLSSTILAASACSSADSGSSGGAGDRELSTSQQKCVDAAEKYFEARGGDLPKTLPSELTPLSKTPEKGVTITRISPANTPISLELNKKLIDAASAVGWVGKGPTYDGSVEDANRKALDAIKSSKAGDVVAHDGIPPSVLQAPIQAAKDAGELFMIGSITDEPQSLPGFSATSLSGTFFAGMGELAAYSIMRSTNCDAHVAAISIPSPPQQDQAKAMSATLKKECPDCTISYTEIPTGDIGAPAATNAVISKLQADPKINFAYFHLGDLTAGIAPALKQAGLDPQIGGALPNKTNVASLKAGSDEFWIGLPTEMTAWVTLDTALRTIDTGKPVMGQSSPLSVLTPDNIGDSDTVPVYPADYQEQFKKLWKVTD
ncbi:sugar ABC transporter substrate-binding protein [Arthrobacter sp. Z4-13]